MYTAIIKFNTLANSVGTGAQYNYFLFIGLTLAFVAAFAVFKSGIEIRCLCFKLCTSRYLPFYIPLLCPCFSSFIDIFLIAIVHDIG